MGSLVLSFTSHPIDQLPVWGNFSTSLYENIRDYNSLVRLTAMGYTPVINALFHPALGLDADELLVLVAMCGAVYLNRGTADIKAAASFLAHRTGRSATTVERRLKSLEQKGMIQRVSMKRPYSYSLTPLFEKLRRLAQVLDAEEGAPPSEPQPQQEEVFLPEEPRAAQFGAPTYSDSESLDEDGRPLGPPPPSKPLTPEDLDLSAATPAAEVLDLTVDPEIIRIISEPDPLGLNRPRDPEAERLHQERVAAMFAKRDREGGYTSTVTHSPHVQAILRDLERRTKGEG